MTAAALIASVVVLGCCALEGWGGDGLLCLLPALLLGLVLLARRYPGERLLVAARAVRRVRWPRARSQVRRRAKPAAEIARGGLLIGRSLAVRPPPLRVELLS